MSDRLRDLASGSAEPKQRGVQAWFAGRGRRREYWLIVVLSFIAMGVVGAFGMSALVLLMSLGITFAFIRRLHDLGHSGWWAPVLNVGLNVIAAISAAVGGEAGAVVGVLPYFAAILILGVIPGEARPNEYGPKPGKADVAETFS